MNILQKFSSDPNSFFSSSQITRKIPAKYKQRLSGLVHDFLMHLRSRAIIVAVDRFPRYRLVGVGYGEFGPELQSSPCISADQIKYFENMAVLARISILNGFELNPKNLASRLSSDYRRIITLKLLNDFIDYMDILDNTGTINDVLYIIAQNLVTS